MPSLSLWVAFMIGVPGVWAQAVHKQTMQNIATLERRATDGDATSQYDLGVTYYQGTIVPKDLVQAAFWYRKAAEQGLANAQYNLALQLMVGLGIPQNLREAMAQFQKAAEKGNPESQYMLGQLYLQGGIGKVVHDPDGRTKLDPPSGDSAIPKDLVLAAKWYRMAADQGNASAQNQLGLLYAAGTGVPQDYAEAYFWLSLATANESHDDTSSMEDRDLAANHLTKTILLETQQRTQDWLKSHPPKVDTQQR